MELSRKKTDADCSSCELRLLRFLSSRLADVCQVLLLLVGLVHSRHRPAERPVVAGPVTFQRLPSKMSRWLNGIWLCAPHPPAVIQKLEGPFSAVSKQMSAIKELFLQHLFEI